MTPKTQFIKEKKNDRWDFIKIKSFCSVQETLKGMKRQATTWEKMQVIYPEYMKNS